MRFLKSFPPKPSQGGVVQSGEVENDFNGEDDKEDDGYDAGDDDDAREELLPWSR